MSESKKLKDRMVEFTEDLQTRICSSLENFESSARFKSENWQRPGGGGGHTRVISGGEVFEKGGVNTSVVYGDLPEVMMKKFGSKSSKFFATGISLVIHPVSPQVPTVHANFRYFEQEDRAWFGGGADLTPYVPNEELAKHFHLELQKACNSFSESAYLDYKKQCDEYFYLPHRKEHRGIGGIFFDYLSDDLENTFKFVQRAGDSFISAYMPVVEKTCQLEYTERQKKFQLLRRGRYVEFNLVYDRGTKFGLETGGNSESILMSLPAVVHFEYKPELETNEDEKKLMNWIRNPKDWL